MKRRLRMLLLAAVLLALAVPVGTALTFVERRQPPSAPIAQSTVSLSPAVHRPLIEAGLLLLTGGLLIGLAGMVRRVS